MIIINKIKKIKYEMDTQEQSQQLIINKKNINTRQPMGII